jgi:hypothetical protein
MFEKCANCGSRVLSGIKNEHGVFCSHQCRAWFGHPGFCSACEAMTTAESSGGTFTFNGIGTKLYGSAQPCSVCESVGQTLWFCIIFIPVIPMSKYRVKYTGPQRFLSRKVVARG